MKVLAAAADDSSGHYRLKLPAASLHDPQVHVEFMGQSFPITHNRRTREYSFTPDCDVFIMQRPTHQVMPGLITHLQSQGIAVVVEIDDDFHSVQSGNLAFRQHHPKVNPQGSFHHFAQCVKRADLVTCSTDALAKRYGSHGRVAVLRNYISSEWLELPRRGDGHTLGWAGSTINHPSDLPSTRGGVAAAMDDHPDWRFVCVGGGHLPDDIWRQLGLEPERVEVTEWRPLGLHELVVSQFDVGIAPLDNIAFNRAKSWLKGLEYAALGIPFVASDLPEYALLHDRYGIGCLSAQKGRHWRRWVTWLMDNDDREAIGQGYRAIIKETLTIDHHAWRWPEAWQKAIERRRRTANTSARPK